MQTILVVDPDPDFLGWAQRHLEAPSARVIAAQDGEEALELFASAKPDLIIADSVIGPFGGMGLLQRIRHQDPNAFVILTSGFPSTTAIIEGMKYGAYEFLRKETLSFDLRTVVEGALKAKEAVEAAERRSKTPAPEANRQPRDEIIGSSPAMQDVFKMIGRVSRSSAPVMVTGESGSGKEVVARAIHRFSPREANDFVAINCAAIPANLLESELFGHEKGSFTGASSRRTGRFEQCANGTLFLDEIGDMPLEIQSKILRVLQEGEFSRVGGNSTLSTDARILAATNKNLEDEVSKGRFREDLFYRLNVVRIHIPPLRNRREDIPELAEFFLRKLAGSGTSRHQIPEDSMEMLCRHSWPGNVRELENTIQRAVVLATTSLLLPKDIPLGEGHTLEVAVPETRTRALEEPPTEPARTEPLSVTEAVEVLIAAAEEDPDLELLPWLEKEMTRYAIQKTGNNQVQAAKLLGITRATLRKRLERFGMREPKSSE